MTFFSKDNLLKNCPRYLDLPIKNYDNYRQYITETKPQELQLIIDKLNTYLQGFKTLQSKMVIDGFVRINEVKNYVLYNYKEIILLPDLEEISIYFSDNLDILKDKEEAWFYPLYIREIKTQSNQAFLRYLIHYFQSTEVSEDEAFFSLVGGLIDWQNRTIPPQLLNKIL